MKSKQTSSMTKHFALPIIRNLQHKRITSRHKANNRSLPKIASTYGEQVQQASVLNNHRPINYDKKTLKEKLKSIHRKKKNFAHLSSLQNESHAQVEEGNITSNFQKQIQKNLMMIKRQKQDHKNQKDSYHKARYNSPRSVMKSFDDIPPVNKKSERIMSEDQNVFLKINQIIMNSQSRQSLASFNQRNISFSAFVKDQKDYHKPISKYNSRKKLKTQPHNNQKYQPIKLAKQLIKHAGNFNEWRKLSIDSQQNGRIKYDVSSYQLQADRLQKIRSKNDLSLKKYFQGKNYLNQLVNYRDSSSLFQKRE